jgi:hypothetical protein
MYVAMAPSALTIWLVYLGSPRVKVGRIEIGN